MAAPKTTYSRILTERPCIAMTFDDGPYPVTTPKLLDLLARKSLKATFFVIGRQIAGHPEIMKRIADEGHEVGNHTWSHPKLAEKSEKEVRDELQTTQDIIMNLTGLKPVLMRPPFGSLTSEQGQWIHDEFGYKIVMWAVDPEDWKKPAARLITQRIVGGAKRGDIILAHDNQPATIEAMPVTLSGLVAKGFEFLTVSDLIAAPGLS